MKFNKKLKKGFTLVELIVVIAIVAILAAVSVVSYVSFIGAANTSADQQAVTQMNKILMLDSILNEDSNIYDLYGVLEQSGLSAKDYKPLVKDRYFFWDRKLNRIVYTDKEYQVIYPAEYEAATKEDGWYSLTNEITKKNYAAESTPVEIDGKQYKDFNIDEAGQLTKIAEDITDGKNAATFRPGYVLGTSNSANGAFATGIVGESAAKPENLHIKLDSDKVDFMGGTFNFSAKYANIIIEGKETGTTICNVVNGDNFGHARNAEGGVSAYGAGLLGYIYDCNVTFKNITIENCYFGTDKYDLVGAGLVGFFNCSLGNYSLTFENVTVKNNYNVGHHGTGAFVGKVSAGGNHSATVNFVGVNQAINCTSKTIENGKLFASGAVAEIQPSKPGANQKNQVIINASASTLFVENPTTLNPDGSNGGVYFAMRDDENANYNNLKVDSLDSYNKFVFEEGHDVVKSTVA